MGNEGARTRRAKRPRAPARRPRRDQQTPSSAARPAAEHVPDRTQRHELGDGLLGLPNVVGLYVGHKHAGGTSTGEYAIVCVVSEKRKVPPSAAIPRRLRFRLTSRSHGSILTDVVELPRLRRAAAPVCGPGDGVFGTSRGTVGIALAHPDYGPVVTSAGHVFTVPGWTGTRTWGIEDRPTVSLRNAPGGENIQGELLKVAVDSAADYALIRPRLDFPPRNVYRDEVPLGVPYQPSADEIGAALRVLGASGERQTTFRGLHGRLQIGPEGLIEELVVTDACTVGGDSGAALVDGYGRVWGLLVGFAEQLSAFMSPFVPMRLEGATYR